MRDAGSRPGTLHLEITESMLLNQLRGRCTRTSSGCAHARVSMYLDDFGTGYSSLSYLQRYPVDALKLDQLVRRAHGHAGRELGRSPTPS